MNIDLLQRLCKACAISGDETAVRDIIVEEITPYVTKIDIDNMGNVIALKKGQKVAEKKLLISAHMDEVGFIVTDITSKGLIKFDQVGGIDRRVTLGKQVLVGDNHLCGVICAKPIHLLNSENMNKIPPYGEMYIDIGAESTEDAEKYISLGDSITFDSQFSCDNNTIMSKALDDRIGCLAMIDMIKSELEYDMWFSFVVQEEVGLRGAKCAAFTVEPDFAIVVEATTAADIPSVNSTRRVCSVGEGAVVAFMDKRTIYDKQLVNIALNGSKNSKFKVQLKNMVAGGNDAGIIHQTKGGVPTLAVSIPCRYLHSGCSLVNKNDYTDVLNTVKFVSAEILSGKIK